MDRYWLCNGWAGTILGALTFADARVSGIRDAIYNSGGENFVVEVVHTYSGDYSHTVYTFGGPNSEHYGTLVL